MKSIIIMNYIHGFEYGLNVWHVVEYCVCSIARHKFEGILKVNFLTGVYLF